MRSNEKRFIFVLIVILVIVIGIKMRSGKKENSELENDDFVQSSQEQEEYVNLLEDGTKINTSEALAKDRKFDELSITDIFLVQQAGTTMLHINVENVSSRATELKKIAVKLLDANGNTLTTLKGIIDPLEPGETKELNIGITSDFANAYDFEVEELN